MKVDVPSLIREDGYKGFFKMGVYTFRHGLFDGSTTGDVIREVLERGNSVAVLPYDPRRDEVMLIQQFLIGAHLAGVDNCPYQVIAGMIEDGDDPAETAYREADEEAACEIIQVLPGRTFLPSPGGTSERIHTFIGVCDLTDQRGGEVHGLAEEGEFVRNEVMPWSRAYDLLNSGKIEVGPAVVSLLYLALERDNIRKQFFIDADGG